jgi:hypothetical protein
MDFTNEINTLESEKLRLEEMLKRNNDHLQLLKEVSTKPSSDGYRRFFKLKGYSLLYTGGKCLNSDYFVFNCTLISTAGHLSRKYWNVEELSKKLEGAKEISKEEFIKCISKESLIILIVTILNYSNILIVYLMMVKNT